MGVQPMRRAFCVGDLRFFYHFAACTGWKVRVTTNAASRSKTSEGRSMPANPGVLKQPVADDDHVLGPRDAPLELVEYGDYQCPHCGKVHPIVRDLVARYGPR